MHSFLLMFSFGLALLFSWIGIGWLVSIALRLKTKDSGTLACLGMAVTVVIGGFLNYFGGISKSSLLAVVVSGVILFLIYIATARKEIVSGISKIWKYAKEHKAVAVIAVIIFGGIVLNYTLAVSYQSYNPGDDYQAYFVYPEKMIQTGNMGADPYSERRTISSLGGQAFLDSSVLTLGSAKNFSLLDMGVAYIAFLLLVIGILADSDLPTEYAIAIFLVAAFALAPIANITAMYTGAALFALAVKLFYKNKTAHFGHIAVFAIIAAALVAFKNTFAPICGIIAVAFFVLRARDFPAKKIWAEIIGSIAVGLACIFPWMIFSKATTGTWFYPILGKGFYGGAGDTFLSPTSQINVENLFSFLHAFQTPFLLVFLTLCIFFLFGKAFRKIIMREDVYLAVSALLGIAVVGVASAGYGVDRYSFAFVFPVLIVLFIRSAKVADDNPKTAAATFVLAGLLVAGGVASFSSVTKNELVNVFRGTDVISQAEISNDAAIQDAVPADATFMERVDKPFDFDFTRNNILVADWPGGSSLPPGMPYEKGPEALVNYLGSEGIRYIAYYYGETAAIKESLSSRLGSTTNAWIRTEAEHAIDFDDDMTIIGNQRERIYDDGNVFVLDLTKIVP